MNHKEQIEAFHSEVTAVVRRFSDEYDLPIASAVGVLEIIKDEIFNGAKEKGDYEP
jgi:hypothetical protein